jgi:hypothetical protein
VLALLALFAVLMITALSVLPKKFDRYALPAFPALAIIAAAGLCWATERVTSGWRRVAGVLRQPRPAVGWTLLTAGLGVNLLWYHPYELAYYNPVLGGGAVAQRVLPVGWGEGYELAGAYIAAQADGCERPVAVWYRVLVERFTCADLIPMREFAAGADAGYVILYIDQRQRSYYPEALARLAGTLGPLHTVRIHGIDYAQIYQLPPPVARPIEAQFGTAIQLRRYDVETDRVSGGSAITLTLDWRALMATRRDYLLFAHVLSALGFIQPYLATLRPPDWPRRSLPPPATPAEGTA